MKLLGATSLLLAVASCALSFGPSGSDARNLQGGIYTSGQCRPGQNVQVINTVHGYNSAYVGQRGLIQGPMRPPNQCVANGRPACNGNGCWNVKLNTGGSAVFCENHLDCGGSTLVDVGQIDVNPSGRRYNTGDRVYIQGNAVNQPNHNYRGRDGIVRVAQTCQQCRGNQGRCYAVEVQAQSGVMVSSTRASPTDFPLFCENSLRPAQR